MKRIDSRHRVAPPSILLLLAGALLIGCGGGGGGGVSSGSGGTSGGTTGMIPSGIQATFMGLNQNPMMNTISMGTDNSAGEMFAVPINVTGVADFYGASFKVRFNSLNARFLGGTAMNSFILTGNPTETRFASAVSATDDNVIEVTATRQGQIAGITPAGTDLLYTLMFEATQATVDVYSVEMQDRRVESCPDGNPLPVCTNVTGNITFSNGTLTATDPP